MLGWEPYYVAGLCEPGQTGALSCKGAQERMARICKDPKCVYTLCGYDNGLTEHTSRDHTNRVQASVVFQVLKNWPVWHAADIQAPYLLVLPENDEM